MIEKLTLKLIRWCEKRNRIIYVTGKSDPTDVYFIRYFVVQSKYFNIFIHRFLRSDRDDPHNHPWDFLTFVVKGGYREHRYLSIEDGLHSWIITRTVSFNRLVFRTATDIHRVELTEELKMKDQALAPITICITGPERQEWGFVKQLTLIPWKRYLELENDS